MNEKGDSLKNSHDSKLQRIRYFQELELKQAADQDRSSILTAHEDELRRLEEEYHLQGGKVADTRQVRLKAMSLDIEKITADNARVKSELQALMNRQVEMCEAREKAIAQRIKEDSERQTKMRQEEFERARTGYTEFCNWLATQGETESSGQWLSL